MLDSAHSRNRSLRPGCGNRNLQKKKKKKKNLGLYSGRAEQSDNIDTPANPMTSNVILLNPENTSTCPFDPSLLLSAAHISRS